VQLERTHPARDLLNEAEMCRHVSDAYKELGLRGLNHGSSGNLSCRVGDKVFMTATHANCESITPAGVVMMDSEGELQGPGIPSCEWQMHIEIYRHKPEAMAVVHTHSDACIALSCLRRPIPAFHYMVAAFGGNDIPCASYAPFGSRELACCASAALRERTACLLANHGMICHSETLAGAVSAAIELEILAKQYLMALQAGNPVILTDSEVSALHQRLSLYCQSQQADGARSVSTPA
jgi:L-fuculose-phosphate aldolase